MKILLAACAFLIVASAGADCLPAKPYVGLYADQLHSKTSVSSYGGAITLFDFWIWWLPSERGLIATEFKVTYPSNVAVTTTVQNPDLYQYLGCVGYVCPVFRDCQADWAWTHHQTCVLLDALPSVIEIGPCPGETVIPAANCEPGNPMELVTIFNKFALNQDAVIAVESQSWGAIKSLYR